MSLAAVFAVAVVLLVVGIVLWKRGGPQATRLASMVLVGVGVVGMAGVVVQLVMFFMNP